MPARGHHRGYHRALSSDQATCPAGRGAPSAPRSGTRSPCLAAPPRHIAEMNSAELFIRVFAFGGSICLPGRALPLRSSAARTVPRRPVRGAKKNQLKSFPRWGIFIYFFMFCARLLFWNVDNSVCIMGVVVPREDKMEETAAKRMAGARRAKTCRQRLPTRRAACSVTI